MARGRKTQSISVQTAIAVFQKQILKGKEAEKELGTPEIDLCIDGEVQFDEDTNEPIRVPATGLFLKLQETETREAAERVEMAKNPELRKAATDLLAEKMAKLQAEMAAIDAIETS